MYIELDEIDNIFEFSFMDDYTTIVLAKEEYGIDIDKLNYEDEHDFYCFSDKKVYKKEDILEKMESKNKYMGNINV